MKKFTTKAVTAAILSSLSLSAAADLYQVEEVPTADNFRHSFARDINAQNFVVGVSRLPETAEIDFERLGIEDPDTLTDEQIVNFIRNLANESTSNTQQQRIGLNQAFYFDTTTQAVEPIPPTGEHGQTVQTAFSTA